MLVAPTEKWVFGQVVVPNHGPVLHPRTGRVLTLPERAANWLVDTGYAVEVAEADLPEETQHYPGRPNCDPSGGIATAKPDPSAWFVEPEAVQLPEPEPELPGKTTEAADEEEEEREEGDEEGDAAATRETEGGVDDADWQATAVDFFADPKTAALPLDDPSAKGIGPKLFAKLIKLQETNEPLTWAVLRANLTDNQTATIKTWAIARAGSI